jgi:hypothetical protein
MDKHTSLFRAGVTSTTTEQVFFMTPTLERRREAKTGRPVGRPDEDPTDRRSPPHDDGRDRPRPVQERGAEAGGRPGLELIKLFFSLFSSLTDEAAK